MEEIKTHKMSTIKIHSGDAFGYSGTSFQARAIQEFQKKEDAASAFLNHTGKFIWLELNDVKELFVLEAGYLPDFKLKAAIRLTPFKHYQEMDGKCYLFKREAIEFPELYLLAMMHYTGYPYDYINLLRNQIWLKLTGIWVGTSKRPQRKLLCHEFVMTMENYYYQLINQEIDASGMPIPHRPLPYPDAKKGRVKDIFNSELYYEFIEL